MLFILFNKYKLTITILTIIINKNIIILKLIGGGQMPLTMLGPGRDAIITACKAKEKTIRFLEGLGLVPGTHVSVVSENSGNIILSVRGSRIAINRGIAQLLMVEGCRG